MSRTQQQRDALGPHLTQAAAERLAEMTEQIAADPAAVGRLFPAAAREVARGPLDESDPSGILGPTLDDAVRGVLVTALAEALKDEEATLRERSEEHTSELQSRGHLVCRLLLENESQHERCAAYC